MILTGLRYRREQRRANGNKCHLNARAWWKGMSFESALGVGKLGLGSAGSVLVKDRGGHVAMTGRG